MVYNVIVSIMQIFIIFAIGGLSRHLKLIEETELPKLSRLVIDIMFPMLIFSSITRNLNPDKLSELWLLPVIGYGLMAGGGLLGFLFKYGMKNRTAERLATFHHFCAINNYVFLPVIILENLWGPKYLPLLFIMNIGFTLGFWTIGVGLLAGGDFRRVLRNIFTINQATVILALLFAFFRIPVPTVINNVFVSLGQCSIPLILLLIGAAIYGSKQIFKNKWDIIYLTAVRLIIIPAVIILILKFIPLPEDIYRISFIVALMPVSASSAVLTRRFGGDAEFAGQAVVVTTLVSIVTIPLMLCFL